MNQLGYRDFMWVVDKKVYLVFFSLELYQLRGAILTFVIYIATIAFAPLRVVVP